ncbi:hypothetical protein [Methylocella silvestris]|uniref:Uncharacterized protein n=1 Tax=Methylocella silvestris TaxID=199596 RepID=A0A2J7TJQ1_METSI|nr:hypothetical protein [Methylocella silvestris]PNG27002.1 hypothetical protein CR492_04680 [Methylocella silvestris]
MAVLTPKTIIGAGLPSVAYAAATLTGDSFPSTSDQRTFLHVKNGSASPITVTILAQTATEKVPGLGSIAVPALSSAIAAAGDAYLGPFPADYIGANGQVQVSYSAVTTVTVQAYTLPKAD